MSTIFPALAQDWDSSGLPGSSITMGQGGILSICDRVRDTTTGKHYRCTIVGTFDNIDTYTGCSFVLDIDDNNLLSTIEDKGWETNTARSWQSVSSPAFSTPRSPNSTNDTKVLAIVSLTSTLVIAAEVDAQIDSGSGYVTRATESLSGLAATTKRTLEFTVPANSSYQLISSGTASIISVSELTE
jgi:hypothetical protein